MTAAEYQELAQITMKKGKVRQLTDEELELLDYSYSYAEEVGEILGPIKKAIFHGHPLDREKLLAELGDAQWYITAIARMNGYTLEDVMEYNINKLKKRYPEGFSEEASRSRDE